MSPATCNLTFISLIMLYACTHWPAELLCCRTITVEQSFCCSVETKGDAAYIQVTTEELSAPCPMS